MNARSTFSADKRSNNSGLAWYPKITESLVRRCYPSSVNEPVENPNYRKIRIVGWSLIAAGFLPGSSRYWFRQGAGRTYAIQREAGVSHQAPLNKVTPRA